MRRSALLPQLLLLPATLLTLAACGEPPVQDVAELEAQSDSIRTPAALPSTAKPSADACGNGLDDDGNGQVDDGCSCTVGTSQACFLGAVRQAGVGACVRGTQTCVTGSGSGEFKGSVWGPCTGSGAPSVETCNGKDDDCSGAVDDAPACKPQGPPPGTGTPPPGTVPCNGVGLIFSSVGDKCIDDGGQSDEDDDLQVYCINGTSRFCLSKEACPWRDGQPTPDTVTCSRAGLAGTYFVSARQACGVYEGKSRICCDMAGKASFTGC